MKAKSQNIYDDDTFFEGYKALREQETCLNDLIEQPAMLDMIPDLKGKNVLDLGCGYGKNCIDFINRGAACVFGVDISIKMLEIAKSESAHKNIQYKSIDMNNISEIKDKFDFVYSSLSFHYIEDFKMLAENIFTLLNVGGCLLFSQEHPIMTATIDGKCYWNKDENGNKISYTFSNYSQSGLRKSHWYVNNVEKYHRTFGETITTLAKIGFTIDEVVEPIPKEWAIEKLPNIRKELLKPNFLIIKARKT